MNGVHKDGGVIRLLMAGALVLLVVACSSSGGVRNDRDMYKAEAEALAGDLAMLKEELATVTGQRDQAVSDLEDAQARMDNLDAEVMRLNQWVTDLTAARDQYKTALDALREKGRDEDVEQIRDLMEEIETLDDRISGIQNEVATLTGERDALMEEVEGDGTADNPGLRQRASDLQAARDELEAERDEAARMAAEELRLRNAELLDRAISGPENRIIDGTSRTGKSLDIGSLAVTRDAAGTVTVSSSTFSNDGTATASADSDWTSVMLAQDDDAGDRTLLVVTNIKPPAPAMFNTVYPANIRLMVLSGTTDADIARRSVAMADLFPTEPSVSRTYGGTSPVYSASFMGTLHGVEGEYECMVDAGCTVSRDADGALVASDGWRFKPVTNVETIMLPDSEWVSFGWWLKTAEGSWDFEGFIWPFAPIWVTGSALNAPTGTASYRGPAQGKFVAKTYENGVNTATEAGDFTADASLDADYGDASTAGTVGGSITGFVLNDERSVPSWSVTLANTSIDTTQAGTRGVTSVDVGRGANDAAGKWGAIFYNAGANGQPDTVTGLFDAVTPGVSMQGAFGANRVEPAGN